MRASAPRGCSAHYSHYMTVTDRQNYTDVEHGTTFLTIISLWEKIISSQGSTFQPHVLLFFTEQWTQHQLSVNTKTVYTKRSKVTAQESFISEATFECRRGLSSCSIYVHLSSDDRSTTHRSCDDTWASSLHDSGSWKWSFELRLFCHTQHANCSSIFL